MQFDLTLPEHQQALLLAITTFNTDFHMTMVVIAGQINKKLGTNISFEYPHLGQPTPANAIQLIGKDYWVEGSTLYSRPQPRTRQPYTGVYCSTSGEED